MLAPGQMSCDQSWWSCEVVGSSSWSCGLSRCFSQGTEQSNCGHLRNLLQLSGSYCLQLQNNNNNYYISHCYCCLVAEWYPDSFATPWTIACQAPLFMGLPRPEYWSGLPFPSPGDLPSPGIEPVFPALADGFFTFTEPPGKPCISH